MYFVRSLWYLISILEHSGELSIFQKKLREVTKLVENLTASFKLNQDSSSAGSRRASNLSQPLVVRTPGWWARGWPAGPPASP